MAKKKAMKKYTVVVHYEGAISYDVEAVNEEEAEEVASCMFAGEDDRAISANIAVVKVCDCREEK